MSGTLFLSPGLLCFSLVGVFYIYGEDRNDRHPQRVGLATIKDPGQSSEVEALLGRK
jgi:hypothetical protein